MTKDILKRCMLEEEEKWREFMPEIPSINFPTNWNVRILPPFDEDTWRVSMNDTEDLVWIIYASLTGDYEHEEVQKVVES